MLTPPPSPSNLEVLRIPTQGNLVASTVEALRKVAMALLATPCSEVVLDLSSADMVDSLGITLILGLFKSCQQKQLAFRVEGASPDLMRVFKLFSLPRLFPVLER